VPWFLTLAIYGEFAFFCCFGLIQSWVLYARALGMPDTEYTHDFYNIVLSLVAKTFLGWALIGPALSLS